MTLEQTVPNATTDDQRIANLVYQVSVGANDVQDATARIIAMRNVVLVDAFETLNAACKWAAGETVGIRTLADADRHMAGYDALVEGAVRVGIAAGVLRGDR